MTLSDHLLSCKFQKSLKDSKEGLLDEETEDHLSFGLNERARNMTVKHQLGNYSFLYLEISNDLPDIEATVIV